MPTSAEELLSVMALLVPDWDLEQFGSIEFLEGGYSNQNFLVAYAGRRYALRIPGPPQPYVDRHSEERFYAELPTGVGVRPIAFDADSGAMLTPWVEGRLLVDEWHNFSTTDLVKYLVDLHRKLPQAERAYDIAQLIDHWLPKQTLPRSAEAHLQAPSDTQRHSCHNDLNPWNIIVTPGGWITLDWEFAGTNDPLFDLVSLHQGLGLAEADLAGMARQYARKTGYCDHREDAQLEQALEVNLGRFWLREYGWAEYQLQQGNDRKEIADQRELAAAKLDL